MAAGAGVNNDIADSQEDDGLPCSPGELESPHEKEN